MLSIEPSQIMWLVTKETNAVKIWRQAAYNTTFAMTTDFKPAVQCIGHTARDVHILTPYKWNINLSQMEFFSYWKAQCWLDNSPCLRFWHKWQRKHYEDDLQQCDKQITCKIAVITQHRGLWQRFANPHLSKTILLSNHLSLQNH